MAEFVSEDLRGSRFERVDLSGASFHDVDLSGSRFRGIALHRAVISGSELSDVEITGEILNLTINGVDVAPLVEAELDRRDPDRVRMRPTDPAGFRAAWDLLEGCAACDPRGYRGYLHPACSVACLPGV